MRRVYLFFGTLALVLATTVVSAFNTDPEPIPPTHGSQFVSTAEPSHGLHCCSLIEAKLTGSNAVFYSSSDEYKQQGSTYYSSEQADLQPSCRVAPRSADEVSVIVSIAREHECEFAVRSGGHMHWAGASNIDASGFTVDLHRLNSIGLSRDQRVVSVGPGCTWKIVYEALQPYGLVALGGRASTVGVGGFLMGGGLSFLSHEFGLASESVLAYEIVLASGEIAIVSPHSHADLYWALKYGSTNFGIVTRFELRTYPQSPEVWAGALFYDPAIGYPLMETLVNFTAKLAQDPKGMSSFGVGWNPAAREYIVCSVNIHLSPASDDVDFPPLFSDLAVFTPHAISNTMRRTTVVGLTDEVSTLLPSGIRPAWWTLTLKADARMMWDLYVHGSDMFRPYEDRPGFNFALNTQPINVGIVEAGLRKAGGNPFGMAQSDGDLILVLATLSWSDPEDAPVLKDTFREYHAWAKAETATRGVLTPFLYMNYAPADADVMGSIGSYNLGRMREIRSAFDPQDVFRKYWKGGFKL
ncbi:hypothetical protein B0H11DRAFT_2336378 [Mycena galericulata]|nr:hypothetical protein B0H11DRAFT_2336378 [Mycena galericulata]